MLLYLFTGDKEEIAKTMYEKQLSKNGIETIVYKETIKRLTELLIQVTQKHEYTLLIDDVSRVPPTGVSALEKLKNHFHIICAARQVKINNISFLTNFERIDLKPFTRTESIELINRMSQPIMDRIEDYETYKNHIFENTNGNPLFIIEMIERYRKEPFISLETVKNSPYGSLQRAGCHPVFGDCAFLTDGTSLRLRRVWRRLWCFSFDWWDLLDVCSFYAEYF